MHPKEWKFARTQPIVQKHKHCLRVSLPPKRPTKLPCSRDSECPQPQLQSCLWVLQYPPVENHTWLEKPPELNGMGHLQKPLIKEVHLTFLSWKIMEYHGKSPPRSPADLAPEHRPRRWREHHQELPTKMRRFWFFWDIPLAILDDSWNIPTYRKDLSFIYIYNIIYIYIHTYIHTSIIFIFIYIHLFICVYIYAMYI